MFSFRVTLAVFFLEYIEAILEKELINFGPICLKFVIFSSTNFRKG